MFSTNYRIFPLFGVCAISLYAQAAPALPEPPRPPRAIRVSTTSMPAGSSYLGVWLAEINSERARVLKLKDEYGVEITHIEDDSPAAKAGLKVDDAVLEYNGQRVEGMEQFGRFVRETPAGRDVKLLISRGGAAMTLPVKIGSRKASHFSESVEGLTFTMPRMPIAPEFHMPDIPKSVMSWRSSILGVEAEGLDGQLAQFFGVKQGVLVRSVLKDSAAAKAGIRAGDVLVKVDESHVGTPGDVSGAIRSLRSKKSFPIVLSRERKEVTVNVSIEDDRSEWMPAPVVTP